MAMTIKFSGELEIDPDRGVIYFHTDDPAAVADYRTVTPLRICNLPRPLPRGTAIDITHMVGVGFADPPPGVAVPKAGDLSPYYTTDAARRDALLSLCWKIAAAHNAFGPVYNGGPSGDDLETALTALKELLHAP